MMMPCVIASASGLPPGAMAPGVRPSPGVMYALGVSCVALSFAPLRSAPIKRAKLRFAPERLAPLRSAPSNLAPEKSLVVRYRESARTGRVPQGRRLHARRGDTPTRPHHCRVRRAPAAPTGSPGFVSDAGSPSDDRRGAGGGTGRPFTEEEAQESAEPRSWWRRWFGFE
jgi:hypothetical protein